MLSPRLACNLIYAHLASQCSDDAQRTALDKALFLDPRLEAAAQGLKAM